MTTDVNHTSFFLLMFCIIRSMEVTLWNYIVNIFSFLGKQLSEILRGQKEKRQKPYYIKLYT